MKIPGSTYNSHLLWQRISYSSECCNAHHQKGKKINLTKELRLILELFFITFTPPWPSLLSVWSQLSNKKGTQWREADRSWRHRMQRSQGWDNNSILETEMRQENFWPISQPVALHSNQSKRCISSAARREEKTEDLQALTTHQQSLMVKVAVIAFRWTPLTQKRNCTLALQCKSELLIAWNMTK